MSLAGKTIKNSIWNLFSFLWPLGLVFLSIPFFISRLGMEEYGIWVLVGSTVGMFEVLNFGVGDAIIKFVSEYQGRNELYATQKIIANCLTLCIMISAAVIVTSLFILPYFTGFFKIKTVSKETINYVLMSAIIGFVLNLFMTNVFAVFKALQRFDVSSMLTMITDTFRIVGMMILVYMGFGLKGMVLAHVGGIAWGLLMGSMFLHKAIPQISMRPSLDLEIMKKIFGFSFFSFLIGISSAFRANIGNILIGRLLGSSSVPYFSVPFQISSKLLAGIASLTMVLFPVFSALKGREEIERIKSIFVNSSRLIITLGFAVGGTMFIFATDILGLWIDSKFALIVSTPFKILIVSFIFTLSATTSYYLLMGYGRIMFIATMQNLSTFLILILGILLVAQYGITGISLAYAVGNASLVIYIFYAVGMLWEKGRKGHIFRAFIPASISLFGGSVILSGFFTLKVTSLAQLIVYVVICVAGFLVLTAAIDHRGIRSLTMFERK